MGVTVWPTVDIDAESLELVNRAAMRLQSDPKSDPVTGAMLGMDNGHSRSVG